MWEMNVDDASNMRGDGVGLVLKSNQGDLIIQAVRCEFKATNNEAEYEALIVGLQLALDLKIRHLKVYSDSQLIVNHVNNSYAARDSTMMAYLEVAKDLKLRFATFDIKQIPRDQNVEADALATLGATFKPGQEEGSETGSQQLQETRVLSNTTSQEEATDWRIPCQDWLQNDILRGDKKEVRSFKMKASRFVLIDDILFRKYLAGPYLRGQEPVQQGPQAGIFLANNAQRCYGGMDIVGPLPKAQGNKVYMLAMTDYFFKWIEAESSSQVTETQVISFIKRNIICRFGISSEIICDNGSQFIGNKTEAFCARKKLEEIGGKWAEELPLVLWADGTTPMVAIGQTPFSLVFGAEAVIPSEFRVPTHRYGCMIEEQNQVEMTSNLDTVDELRTNAQIRMASY
ncbi:uncharacterized protein LOC141628866 [Silene latifolia]|uniref:uncharacterized protein LOC141628866 n=1 Tax=Silene latifolia TaxID=37657 RepID=UPI003D77EC8F